MKKTIFVLILFLLFFGCVEEQKSWSPQRTTKYKEEISHLSEKFSYSLNEGYNLISLPFNPIDIKTAEDLLIEIENQAGLCKVVRFFDGAIFLEHTKGAASDFDLGLGVGYHLICERNSELEIIKDFETHKTNIRILGGVHSFVGFPKNKYSAKTFLEYLNSNGADCESIIRYNPLAETYSIGSNNDFDLEVGKGYAVFCNKPYEFEFE